MTGDLIGKQILDGGCGTGIISNLYQLAGANVVCIDINSEMLIATRNRMNNQGNYFKANVIKIPFKSDTFDIISLLAVDPLSNSVSIDKGERPLLMNEAKRVLKRKGKILIEVGNKTPIKVVYGSKLDYFIPKLYDTNWLKKYLEDNNFINVRYMTINNIPYNIGARFDIAISLFDKIDNCVSKIIPSIGGKIIICGDKS